MQAALFTAGLGDCVRTIYKTRHYQMICEARERVAVLVGSHNPFALEIFRFHRNARNFVLYDVGHMYQAFFEDGLRGPDITKALCEFAGVDYASLPKGDCRDFTPLFDAPDDVASTGHIVFQPYAGNANYRTWDDAFIERVLDVLRRQPCPVFLITRSYIRKSGDGKVIHALEDARRWAGGNIQVLEHLSVPASLNLIKSCRAYVGSWSSLHQAAWFENKPVAVFYPPDYVDVRNRTGYAFGLDRENTLHAEYPAADMEQLDTWLKRWD